MNFLSYITQFTGQHQFHLGVNILYPLFYHKFTALSSCVDILQLRKQQGQFFFCQQTDTFQHRDMCHGTQHIMLCQIKIHLTVTSHRKTLYILIYLNGLFPKFLSHKI